MIYVINLDPDLSFAAAINAAQEALMPKGYPRFCQVVMSSPTEFQAIFEVREETPLTLPDFVKTVETMASGDEK